MHSVTSKFETIATCCTQNTQFRADQHEHSSSMLYSRHCQFKVLELVSGQFKVLELVSEDMGHLGTNSFSAAALASTRRAQG